MNAAFDIDGVIDAFPRECQSLMSALSAAGHHVYVITGVEADQVTSDDIAAKREYLIALGISRDCYDQLIVCPQPHDQNKAEAIKANDIAVLFDNSKANIKAAQSECAAFLLWNSRTD